MALWGPVEDNERLHQSAPNFIDGTLRWKPTFSDSRFDQSIPSRDAIPKNDELRGFFGPLLTEYPVWTLPQITRLLTTPDPEEDPLN